MADLLALFFMPLLVLIGMIYFLPTLIAVARGHRRALLVGLTNLLLGWTLVGWAWALLWALIGGKRRRRGR